MADDGGLDAGEEGVLGVEVGVEVVRDRGVRGRGGRGGGGRLGLKLRNTRLPPFLAEINPDLLDVVYAPDDVLDRVLVVPQQRLQPVQVGRRDIIRLETDDEVDLRGVRAFEAVRFDEVGMKGPFEVGRGQIRFFRVQILRAVPGTVFAEPESGQAAGDGGPDAGFEGARGGVAAELARVRVVRVHCGEG